MMTAAWTMHVLCPCTVVVAAMLIMHVVRPCTVVVAAVLIMHEVRPYTVVMAAVLIVHVVRTGALRQKHSFLNSIRPVVLIGIHIVHNRIMDRGSQLLVDMNHESLNQAVDVGNKSGSSQ
jgi:hypothetical protein